MLSAAGHSGTEKSELLKQNLDKFNLTNVTKPTTIYQPLEVTIRAKDTEVVKDKPIST